MPHKTISEMAENIDVTLRTLRFYEERGLISSTRDDRGKRVYSELQQERVRDVCRLAAAGFSIRDIHEWLYQPRSRGHLLQATKQIVHDAAFKAERQKMLIDAIVPF